MTDTMNITQVGVEVGYDNTDFNSVVTNLGSELGYTNDLFSSALTNLGIELGYVDFSIALPTYITQLGVEIGYVIPAVRFGPAIQLGGG